LRRKILRFAHRTAEKQKKEKDKIEKKGTETARKCEKNTYRSASFFTNLGGLSTEPTDNLAFEKRALCENSETSKLGTSSKRKPIGFFENTVLLTPTNGKDHFGGWRPTGGDEMGEGRDLVSICVKMGRR
jgi:hypothetical protein